MMRYVSLAVVLILLFSWGPAQAQTLAAGNGRSSASSAAIAPETPVVTLEGLCDQEAFSIAKPVRTPDTGKPTVGEPGCQSVITRRDFEQLSAVVAPNVNPASALQLARFYSEQLAFAHKARELHLDKDPHFEEILRFTYLQVLSRALNNRLQEEADRFAETEFSAAVKLHPEQFEQVYLRQISILKQKKHKVGPASTGTRDTAAEQAAMKAVAEDIYRRATGGEDFAKLQKEAYAASGNPEDSPDSEVGLVTRAQLGTFHEAIFGVPAGQISPLLDGPEAWHIFRIVSKGAMSPHDAKQMIAGQRLKETLDAMRDSVGSKLNDGYFTAPPDVDPAQVGVEAK